MVDIATLHPGDVIRLVDEESLAGHESDVCLVPRMRKFLGEFVTVLETRHDTLFDGKPYVTIVEDYDKGINGDLDHFGWLPATIDRVVVKQPHPEPVSDAELSEFLSF